MIRPYTLQDKAIVCDIYNSAKLDELTNEPTQFQLIPLEKDTKRSKLIFDSNITLYEANTPGGFVAYNDGCINGLYVHANSRCEGIGRLLLDEAINAMGGHAWLQVTCSNRTAINLYSQRGFKVVSEYQAEYNGHKVLVNKMVL